MKKSEPEGYPEKPCVFHRDKNGKSNRRPFPHLDFCMGKCFVECRNKTLLRIYFSEIGVVNDECTVHVMYHLYDHLRQIDADIGKDYIKLVESGRKPTSEITQKKRFPLLFRFYIEECNMVEGFVSLLEHYIGQNCRSEPVDLDKLDKKKLPYSFLRENQNVNNVYYSIYILAVVGRIYPEKILASKFFNVYQKYLYGGFTWLETRACCKLAQNFMFPISSSRGTRGLIQEISKPVYFDELFSLLLRTYSMIYVEFIQDRHKRLDYMVDMVGRSVDGKMDNENKLAPRLWKYAWTMIRWIITYFSNYVSIVVNEKQGEDALNKAVKRLHDVGFFAQYCEIINECLDDDNDNMLLSMMVTIFNSSEFARKLLVNDYPDICNYVLELVYSLCYRQNGVLCIWACLNDRRRRVREKALEVFKEGLFFLCTYDGPLKEFLRDNEFWKPFRERYWNLSQRLNISVAFVIQEKVLAMVAKGDSVAKELVDHCNKWKTILKKRDEVLKSEDAILIREVNRLSSLPNIHLLSLSDFVSPAAEIMIRFRRIVRYIQSNIDVNGNVVSLNRSRECTLYLRNIRCFMYHAFRPDIGFHYLSTFENRIFRLVNLSVFPELYREKNLSFGPQDVLKQQDATQLFAEPRAFMKTKRLWRFRAREICYYRRYGMPSKLTSFFMRNFDWKSFAKCPRNRKLGYEQLDKFKNFYDDDSEMRYMDRSMKCCELCHKRNKDNKVKLKVCSRCKQAFYCSRECQKKDWKRHKKQCTTL